MNNMLIPRQLHEAALKMMKRLLDLGELAFGKDSGAFRNYRAQMMGYAKDLEIEQFAALESARIVERCDCGDSLDSGPRWSRCALCAGSGFRPVKETDEDTG